jgi:hypothetical protein
MDWLVRGLVLSRRCKVRIIRDSFLGFCVMTPHINIPLFGVVLLITLSLELFLLDRADHFLSFKCACSMDDDGEGAVEGTVIPGVEGADFGVRPKSTTFVIIETFFIYVPK